jgi:hypothetical protein
MKIQSDVFAGEIRIMIPKQYSGWYSCIIGRFTMLHNEEPLDRVRQARYEKGSELAAICICRTTSIAEMVCKVTVGWACD